MTHLESRLDHLTRLDDVARRPSPAVSLDPRAKVVATLAFVGVVASFGRHDLGRLAPLALFPVGLAVLGDVPWRPLLLRLAIASPFALGVAAFEPFLDHRPALMLGPWVVSGGVLAFATILAKFALTLGAAIVLVATTGFDEVCAALGRLAVPRALVSQLMLSFRYLFLLSAEASRMLRAHAMRAPNAPRPPWRIAGTMLGQLLLRAIDRAERMHTAMRCRGFDGRLRVRRAWRWRRGDVFFAAATVVLLVVSRADDVPARVGTMLLGAEP